MVIGKAFAQIVVLTLLVGSRLIVTVVEQVEVVHPLFTTHVIVDTPGLNTPLASFPDPLPFVTPVIVKEIFRGLPQLSDAVNVGIV